MKKLGSSIQEVILCQPSSAAVERVFSILKSSDQNQALEDYNSLMSQCTNRLVFLFFF